MTFRVAFRVTFHVPFNVSLHVSFRVSSCMTFRVTFRAMSTIKLSANLSLIRQWSGWQSMMDVKGVGIGETACDHPIQRILLV